MIVQRGESLSLPARAAACLRERLEALSGSGDLLLAVRSLIALAAHLERDRGAVECADALLRVAATASAALSALGASSEQTRSEAVLSRRQTFSRFTDRLQATRAPRFGARAPAGAVRAGLAQIPTVFR